MQWTKTPSQPGTTRSTFSWSLFVAKPHILIMPDFLTGRFVFCGSHRIRHRDVCEGSWHISFANACFSSKQLERDPSETATELLVVLVSHFNGSGIPPRSKLSLDRFAAPASARVTNAFWYLSLSLALVVSMLAILAKQWITMFSSRMRAPAANFRQWAHRHRVFRDGIDRWHINAFVSSLSVALHGAVLMFMAGLIVHLFTRDLIIFGLVLGITVLAAVFYVAATVAPLFDGTCPTATPLLIHGRLVYLAAIRVIRCLSESPVDRPPFDPDVVLADGNDYRRDMRIFVLMSTDLQSRDDVETAIDAVGALKSEIHDLGDHSVRLRYLCRRRLDQFGSTGGIATSDYMAVARALRSSILIESCCEYAYWVNIETLVTTLRLIRTHDIFVLSTALQLLLHAKNLKELSNFSPIQRSEWEKWYVIGRSRWVEDAFYITKATTTAIARWKIRVPLSPDLWQPVPSHIYAHLFDSISHIITSPYRRREQVDLKLCAALIIGFGGESNLREQCNMLVTPLAIAALDRECYQRVRTLGRPAWQPLPDSENWRLRAIDVWAQVTSEISRSRPSTSLAGEVYSLILTHLTNDDWQFVRLTPVLVGKIAIPPDQLNLPAAGRATLWNISKCILAKTPGSALHLDVISHVLHGVSPDEMVAAHPAIIKSIASFLREQLCGHRITYERYYGACNHLMAVVEPNISTTSSRPGSIWQILHPYLVALQDDDGLTSLADDASAVLLIYAWMGSDLASAIFEQLLGGSVGRRAVLSYRYRSTAFRFATHARFFAQTWWASMRNELLGMDDTTGTWTGTYDYQDAATFVRKVEEAEMCSYCMQKCFEWQPRLEEDRYNDAWIQYGEGTHELVVAG